MIRKPALPTSLLGIEAGGTRTVALLANLHGQLIQRLEAGPANLKLLSDAELVRHFRSLARALPRPAAIGIGIAGARTETDRARLRETVRIAWGRLPVRVSADLETALAAAGESRGGAAQVLVLCGTGSCCFGQRHGDRSVRVGGWGHILGDQGSGFDIAMRALRAVIAEFDRLGRWPRLGQRLLRELLLNEPNDLIPWAQAAPKQEVARLAAEVFAAWHEGDRLAAVVVRGAADALVQDALECARKLAGRRERVRFVFAGGVLLRQPRFAALLRAALQKARPGSTAEVLSRESAWGAVELAKRALTEAGRSASRTTDRRGLGTPTSLPLLPTATGASPTESRNPRSLGLDKLSVSAAVRLMIAEDRRIPGALLREERQLTRTIDLIVRALYRRGRLIYVGAGTSGRLGVLDASECPPTFGTPPELVQGIIAGGHTALWQAVEGAEDDFDAGVRAIKFRGISRRDVVVGIAASGRTPFVWGALCAARQRGARTVLLCFNPHLRFAAGTRPDVVITPRVGPEILTGSTRLKAGTATKLILNLFTTLAMVRIGKVVSNLMVDLRPSNAKLRERAVRIVRQLTDTDGATARAALEAAGWGVKAATARLSRMSAWGFSRPTRPAKKSGR